MSRKIILFFTILIFVALSSAFAQEKRRLTVEECVDLGLKYNKNLQISKSKIVQAEERTKEVNAGRLPALKFNGGYTRLSPVEPFILDFSQISPDLHIPPINISPSILNTYQLRVGLTQPIFTGFRLENNTEISELNESAARQDYRKDEKQLILDVKNAYWTVYNAMQLKKITEETFTQVQSHLTDVQDFFNSGLATNNEVLKVQVQLSNTGLVKIDADNAVKLSTMALNNQLGLSLDTEIELASEPVTGDFPLPDLKAIVDSAFERRPEVKAMKLRYKAGEAGVKVAESSLWPQVNFSANYYYNRPNQRLMPPPDKFSGTWDVGLSLSYDIWNWQTASHQAAQAKEMMDQTGLALKQIKDGIYLEVSQSYLNLEKSKSKIQAARGTLDQAQENYRVTKDKYEAGLVINSELIDAEMLLFQAKANLATSISEGEVVRAIFEKAISK